MPGNYAGQVSLQINKASKERPSLPVAQNTSKAALWQYPARLEKMVSNDLTQTILLHSHFFQAPLTIRGSKVAQIKQVGLTRGAMKFLKTDLTTQMTWMHGLCGHTIHMFMCHWVGGLWTQLKPTWLMSTQDLDFHTRTLHHFRFTVEWKSQQWDLNMTREKGASHPSTISTRKLFLQTYQTLLSSL